MTINGIDISTWNAKQRTITPNQHHKLNSDSEWLPGSAVPYLSNLYIVMRSFTVTLWVYGANRNEINQNCSNIIAKCLVPVTLAFDGFPYKFRGTLDNLKQTETSKYRWHVLELTFVGYLHGDDVAVSGYSSVTVNNPGNLDSPAVVEITPRTGASNVHLTGICKDSFTSLDLPVTIPEVTAAKTIRLDTLTGLVTEDGLPKDIDMWALPSFRPGLTAVTCDNDQMGITVTVRPIYM